MDRFDFASSRYGSELQRRTDLNTAVTTLAGIVALLIAGIFTIAGDAHLSLEAIPLWLDAACLTAAAFAIAAIYFLIRAYHGYIYRYSPTVFDLENWRKAVIATGYTSDQADAQLRDFLISAYADANQINTVNNEAKSGYQNRATGCLVGCVAALMIASPAYLLAKHDRDELHDQSRLPICRIELRIGNHDRQPAAAPAAAPAATTADAGHPRERGAASLPLGADRRAVPRGYR